ncbi:hypothetical protein DL96DRAFT_902400 [Flagelloscypha sp. PMI_526]|nr:hypothetical protein DL96DRAFT_902400 [Flagelloscypha sp. PMI_526]
MASTIRSGGYIDLTDGPASSSSGYATRPTRSAMASTSDVHPPLQALTIPPHPRLSRSCSVPLPSQLGRLRHPHRSDDLPPSHIVTSPISASSPEYRELALELADSAQNVIQTLLQVSPMQILDPTKEQLSACSMSVPTPSMSALLTVMKNINYLSANIHSLCGEDVAQVAEGTHLIEESVLTDFDIGEMLQSIGDSLSGTAAQAGVDLVLYHDDIGVKHVWVRGDESGLSYVLSHVMRQVLASCSPGDSVELGLRLNDGNADGESAVTPPEAWDCTISVYHRFQDGSPPLEDALATSVRPPACLDGLILRRLLRHINASLKTVPPPPKMEGSEGRTVEISLRLERGTPTVPSPTSPGSPEESGTPEPSMEQLSAFSNTLRGKKVALYASSDGSFARHLSSYLTAWGLEVTHIPADGQAAKASPTTSTNSNGALGLGLPTVDENLAASVGLGNSTVSSDSRVPSPSSWSLVLVDDDVNVLQERVEALRQEPPAPAHAKRPSLAPHHRPRSSPQVARAMGRPIPPPPSSPVSTVIVHFTSLGNYKTVKDMIETRCGQYAMHNIPVPEVLVIPKPAGPRRFLTALHTALTRPRVDPFFMPIATSPGTPNLSARASFVGTSTKTKPESHSPESPHASLHRPNSSRTNSDRSRQSNSHPDTPAINAGPQPSSPLALSETGTTSYFGDSSSRQLGSSPSSGVILGGEDGQSARIFFSPRGKGTSRTPSTGSVVMERDAGPNGSPTQARVTTTLPAKARNRSPGSPTNTSRMSFSSLHEAAHTPALDPSQTPPLPTTPSSVVTLQEATTPRPLRIVDTNAEVSSPTKSDSARQGLPISPTKTASTASPPGSPPKATSTPKKAGLFGGATASSTDESNIIPPISVLIVEDNPVNRGLLAKFMKQKKIKYETAVNGEEAVQKWSSGAFHLVLMDIEMPVMDGIQATKEIRRLEKLNSAAGYPLGTPSSEKTPPLPASNSSSLTTSAGAGPSSASSGKGGSQYGSSSVIIVALTANSGPQDRTNALAAGCNDFLTKPISLRWLDNKIIEWGSIKALQMWGDLRAHTPGGGLTVPGVMESKEVAKRAMGNANAVAEKLHLPGRGRAGSSLENGVAGVSAGITAASATASVSPPVVSNDPLSSSASGLGAISRGPHRDSERSSSSLQKNGYRTLQTTSRRLLVALSESIAKK